MARRHLVLVFVTAGYLLVVLCGALKVRLSSKVPVGQEGARTLLYCCGADNSYGFFAPTVMDEVALEFQYSAGAKTWTESLDSSFKNEARQRSSTTVDIFAHIGDQEVQQTILESWAAWALARQPEADSVRVTVKHRVMPTMAEYRQGVRPAWREWASATFHRCQAAD